MATADTLQAEARERPRMTIVAIVAAAFTLAAPIVGLVVLKDTPSNLIGQAKKKNPNVNPGRFRELIIELVGKM